MRFASTLAFVALLGLPAAPALAMEATQTIEREVSVTQADGSVMLSRAPADLVKPGDALIYTLDFVNTEAEPVSGIKMAMPVPAEVRFVETVTALRDSTVSYSADGGQSFSSMDTLQVATASGGQRPATADDVTHVRWSIDRAIEVGEQGTVAFRAQLR